MTSVYIDDFKLIELVKPNKHLYDKSSVDYRDPLKKDITWKAIAVALGTTADIVQKRFRCLRDRFNKERKKAKKKEVLMETASFPLIFKKMMFLWDHLSHRSYRFSTSQLLGLEDQASGGSVPEQEWPDSETQAMFETQVEKLSHIEEQVSAEIESKINIVEETVRMCYEAEMNNDYSYPGKKRRKVRRIRPKITTYQQNKKLMSDINSNENNACDLYNQPLLVALQLKESNDCVQQNVQMVTSQESTVNAICDKRNLPVITLESSQSLVNNDCDQNTKQLITTPELPVSLQNESEPKIPSSQLSCNEAFCLMLKDYLDKVTNPLKLSLLRIKILTILHNELYG